MAVRTKDESQDSAPAQGGGGIGFLGNPILIMLALVGIGFLSNNYLIAEQKAYEVKTEYRGYRDGVRDVR